MRIELLKLQNSILIRIVCLEQLHRFSLVQLRPIELLHAAPHPCQIDGSRSIGIKNLKPPLALQHHLLNLLPLQLNGTLAERCSLPLQSGNLILQRSTSSSALALKLYRSTFFCEPPRGPASPAKLKLLPTSCPPRCRCRSGHCKCTEGEPGEPRRGRLRRHGGRGVGFESTLAGGNGRDASWNTCVQLARTWWGSDFGAM
mmetsp:Transcript_66813/g.168716  ORF Transcript_66813/g.168716 Transcript_66813/m.168716 type:complete len:201 (+) Transcript_66813:1021-1623(+)